jgi:hypothetical protein
MRYRVWDSNAGKWSDVKTVVRKTTKLPAHKRKHGIARWPILIFLIVLVWKFPALLILAFGILAASFGAHSHTSRHSDAHGDGNGEDT